MERGWLVPRMFQETSFRELPTTDHCLDINRNTTVRLKVISFNKVLVLVKRHSVRLRMLVRCEVAILKPLVEVEANLLAQVRFNRAPNLAVQA